MNDNQLKARVERGIIFLDAKEEGWPVRIDLNELDVGLPSRCIIGQLRGDFTDGLADLDLSLEQAQDMGFYLYPGEADYYDDLTEAWRERLKVLPRASALQAGEEG